MGQVIVTGGGTGIGRAVAGWFTERGHNVTIIGRREDVLKKTADKIGASYVVRDLSDGDALQGGLPQIPDGGVDILVNNAGGVARLDQASDGDEELTRLSRTAREWTANFNANVLTAVLTTTALEDQLNDGARIITLGSIAARTGGGAYGAAKAALEAWNVSLASALGSRGITANVVAPGLTTDTEFFGGNLSQERYDRLVVATRTGRAGTPDDVASVVGFLASPEAEHITGQVVHVNGGAYSGH